MRKMPSSEKVTEYYELGNGWYMIHVKTKTDGKVTRVDTFVGMDEDGFSRVAHTEGIDAPGVIGGYLDYLKTMRMYADGLIDLAQKNMRFPMWGIKHGKRNTEKYERGVYHSSPTQSIRYNTITIPCRKYSVLFLLYVAYFILLFYTKSDV